MGKIAILTIHGIGQQKPGFAKVFHEKLLKSLSPQSETQCFEFEWQHLIETQEEFLAGKLNHLQWNLSRNFALTFVGDAVAYAKDSVFYKAAHKELDKKLTEINSWLDEDGKLYIIAHSLGSIIIYNYIYNLQNFSAQGNSIFRALDASTVDKLDCLFTVGSPLYIYSLQRENGGNPLKINKWKNVYSVFDVIGYPVKKINADFEQSIHIEDKPIICGGPLTFWNAVSHISYFDSYKFIGIIKQEVNKNE